MNLEELVDLSDLVIADIGAGTGRATLRVSEKAKHVYAIDVYHSVVKFGRALVQELDLRNVDYVQGDGANTPYQITPSMPRYIPGQFWITKKHIGSSSPEACWFLSGLPLGHCVVN